MAGENPTLIREAFAAAHEGNVDRVLTCLRAGFDINQRRPQRLCGKTLLHEATCGGHTRLVEVLVQNGASLQMRHTHGWTLLHDATWHGHLDTLRVILGLEVNDILDAKTYPGRTALHLAAEQGNVEVIKALIHAGASIDVRDKAGETPLGRAVCKGRLEAVILFLKAGATLLAATSKGKDPSHTVTDLGNLPRSTALLRVSRGTVDNRDTHLHNAVFQGNIDLVRTLAPYHALITSTLETGDTPLHSAAALGRLDIVEALLQAGALTDATNANGGTPLHDAVRERHLDVVEALIRAGSPIDVQNVLGEAPLHIAVKLGRLTLVEALLRANASVTIVAKDGETPLHNASSAGALPIVLALLQAGASPNGMNRNGSTSLHKAVSSGYESSVEILIRDRVSTDLMRLHGSGGFSDKSRKNRLRVVKLLLKAGADPAAVNEGKDTPLHYAVWMKDIVMAKNLLHAGAPTNAVGSGGWTPLSMALYHLKPLDQELLDLLLYYGPSTTGLISRSKRFTLRIRMQARRLTTRRGLDYQYSNFPPVPAEHKVSAPEPDSTIDAPPPWSPYSLPEWREIGNFDDDAATICSPSMLEARSVYEDPADSIFNDPIDPTPPSSETLIENSLSIT